MNNTAIVLAAFGATIPEGLRGIGNIVNKVRDAFECPVEVCFTSNIVRGVWQKRLAGGDWLRDNPDTPDFIQNSRGTLATMAALQDRGYKNQVVQPLHIYAGEEYHDLGKYVAALAGIDTIKAKWRPFNTVALGRPALGAPGVDHPYMDDIKRAAEALESDIDLARQKGAALVYVGHGNHVFSTGVYHELQQILKLNHPDVPLEIGAVEGMFDAEYVAGRLSHKKADKVLLKPLMVVAGVHARDDMAGDDEDSWRSVLINRGFDVECRMQGLGESDAWASIYVQNIIDAAADAGIDLHTKVA